MSSSVTGPGNNKETERIHKEVVNISEMTPMNGGVDLKADLTPTSLDEIASVEEGQGPALFQQMATSIKGACNRDNAILAGKILLVVLLVGGLITASVFAFGAALAMAGSVGAASGWGSFVGISSVGALFGLGAGLGASGAIVVPEAAMRTKLFEKADENNPDKFAGRDDLRKVSHFLGVVMLDSVCITAVGVASGANEILGMAVTFPGLIGAVIGNQWIANRI